MTLLVHPNLHPAMTHFPLGLLLTGVAIEFFSFLGWRRSPLRAAGRWMILLGVLSAVPVCMSGVYALHDVTTRGLGSDSEGQTWREVVAQSPLVHDTVAWNRMTAHTLAEASATGLMLLAVVIWIGSTDEWRRRLHLLVLLALLLGVAIAGRGAHHSGEAVYTNGVGVERRAITSQVTPTPPVRPEAAPTTNAAATRPASPIAAVTPLAEPSMPSFPNVRVSAADVGDLRKSLDEALPPLQNHVIFAGIAVALAALSIGLTFRASHVPAAGHNVGTIAAALGGVSTPSRDAFEDVATVEPRSAGVDTELLRDRVPSARFWLLTFLLAAATLGLGWWVLASDADIWDIKRLWDLVFNLPGQNAGQITRRQAHVICGAAIVALPLLLALAARLAPRRKLLLGFLSLLLVVAISGQVWLGVLMMYDTNAGPITHFAPADTMGRP